MDEVIVVPATRTSRGIDTEVVLTEDDGMPTACALNFDHLPLAWKERLGARPEGCPVGVAVPLRPRSRASSPPHDYAIARGEGLGY